MKGFTSVPLMVELDRRARRSLSTVSNERPCLVMKSLAWSHSVNFDHGPTKMWKLQCAGSTRERDAGLLLEGDQVGIGACASSPEQREVGQRGDEAAGQDDLQPADLVAQPAEEDEERRADEERVRRSACRR